MAMNNKGRDSHNSDRTSQSGRDQNSKSSSNRKNASDDLLNGEDNQDIRPTRKPGSQSNSSKQSNNGRGGGK